MLNKIELTSLKDIVKSINIYFDPDESNTNVKEDKEILEIYRIFEKVDPCLSEDGEGCRWIIRFEFDKQDMINKNITMEDIYHKINLYYGSDIRCVYSDDNADKLVFRIRVMKFKKSENDKMNDLNILKQISQNIREKVIVKGIVGITNVSMYKNKNNYECNRK